MWMIVHATYLVLSSAILSNEIVCYSFLVKNLVVVVCVHQQQREFIPQPQNRKVVEGTHNVLVHFMWMIVHPTYLVLSYGTWNPFKWDINFYFYLIESLLCFVLNEWARVCFYMRSYRRSKIIASLINPVRHQKCEQARFGCLKKMIMMFLDHAPLNSPVRAKSEMWASEDSL